MENLTTSSHICIKIVLAFLHFLSTVQHGNKEEKEGIRRVVKSLKTIFKITPEMVDNDDQKTKRPGILEVLFGAPQDDSDEDEPCSSTAPSRRPTPYFNVGSANMAVGRNMVNFQNEFRQLVLKNGSLLCFLGHNTPKTKLLRIIANIFKEALVEITQKGPFRFNMKEFAGNLKEMGNKAMEEKSYPRAARFYSCVIALSGDEDDNALHYFNRGKALIKVGMYQKAVDDCCKAVCLNPSFVKAYYSLGEAYTAQNKYFDAIHDGFLRALELDPKNKEALTQLELAESKLSDQLSWLDDKLEELRKKGKIKRCRKLGIKEGSALIYKGKGQDGNSDGFVFVEQEKFNPEEIEETMSIQEFIQLFSQGNIA